MSFKNLDKVGIGTNTDGSVQFVQKVQNPKQEKFDNVSVGQVELSAVQTLTDLLLSVSIVNVHVVLQTLTVEASL